MATTDSTEILHDFFPMLRVYKDGRFERLLGKDVVPASVDEETGVQSKDVRIAPELYVSARLYLPKDAKPGEKLPLLVYFHGGGFMVESAFSPTYHTHLNLLVAEANVMVASVDYRLAPEHPIPTAYEDSWLALKWVASHSRGDGPEAWLNHHADFDRVFLGGDSAGGNIAHNMGIRAGLENLDGLNLDGIILNCPYFWGEDPIPNEITDMNIRSMVCNIWLYVSPGTAGLDDPLMNPATNPNLSKLGCKRVLVNVAEKDVLAARGWYYKELLNLRGWTGEVEVKETKEENHVFYLFQPTSDNAVALLKAMASFLNQAQP